MLDIRPRNSAEIATLAIAVLNHQLFMGPFILADTRYDLLQKARLLKAIFLPIGLMEFETLREFTRSKCVPYQFMEQQVGTTNGNYPSFIEMETMSLEDAKAVVEMADKLGWQPKQY